MYLKSKEEQKTYQNIITQKLRDLLGEYEVDILTEYVWHMAGNTKSSSEFMCNELKDFLGDHTTVFVNWLMKFMSDIKKQKKNEIQLKNEKSNKNEYSIDNQFDELSKFNKSRESRTRQSNIHKKTKGYSKENEKRKDHYTRKRSRSYGSKTSKYSNEDSYFSKKRNKKRQKRDYSNRSSTSSSNLRKIHYDKNKIKIKKTDKCKEGDKLKLKEKYKKENRSTSNSFSPSRVIYVEKEEQKKEKKNENFSVNSLNKNDLDLRKKNENADEYTSNGKKNKAILKPNPRFVGDNTIPYMQPPAPSVNVPDVSGYNMNYGYDNMNIKNFDKNINSMGNFFPRNYVVPQQNTMDNSYISNNMNNNFFNTRYANNVQQKNINMKMNITKNPPQNNINVNRFNNPFPKNNINSNMPNTHNNDNINVNVFSKQPYSNIRNPSTFYMNTNNTNGFMDKFSQSKYIPKNNKQQNIFQPIMNSDKNVKTQQQYISNLGNQNSYNQQTTQNIQINKETSIQQNIKKNTDISDIQQNNVQKDETKEQSPTKVNESNQIINSENTSSNPNVIIKIQKKCLFLPNCQYGDKCRYIHPTENCRNWPYCAFGSECIYIHPDVPCKFGVYCCNYYCNYSHKNINTSTMPEMGSLGYFSNKKLINNNDKNNNAENFDDKVAQISISMPKTPPEMRKDKKKGEHNENNIIQNILDTEKQDLNNNDLPDGEYNTNGIINERKTEKEYEGYADNNAQEDICLKKIPNNKCTNDNEINGTEEDNKNMKAIDYNCFEIVVNPDTSKDKNCGES